MDYTEMQKPFADDRRFRRVAIPHHLLLNALCLNATQPHDVVSKISLKGVPPGTIVIGGLFDVTMQSDFVLLYNAAWDPVPDGYVIPLANVEFEAISVNVSLPRSQEETTQPLADQLGTWRDRDSLL